MRLFNFGKKQEPMTVSTFDKEKFLKQQEQEKIKEKLNTVPDTNNTTDLIVEQLKIENEIDYDDLSPEEKLIYGRV